MRRPKKFAEGGSTDKAKARYDRKVADIKSDFEKWKKSGKYGNESVAKAKYEQRMADANDDLAKWTKSDRTQTRAAEKAAESALSESRRTKGLSTRVRDFAMKGDDEPIKTKVDTSLAGKPAVSRPAPKKVASVARKVERKPKATQSAGRSGTGSTGGGKPPVMGGNKVAQPPENKGAREIVVEGRKPKPKQWVEGKTAGERMGNVIAAPFKAIAKYNPLSLAARAMLEPSTPAPSASPRGPTPLEQERKVRNARIVAEARAAGNESKARFYEKNPNALKNGGKVKALAYAKGGSIDGAAIRGKTKIKRK